MDKPTAIRITNVKVFTEQEVLRNHSVLINNGKIAEITPESEIDTNEKDDVKQLDGLGLNLIPGFIDGHIHGAAGADVMDASNEALDTIASALPKEGTTSFLATTITQSVKNIEKALLNIKKYQSKSGAAEVLGVHLEGPYIEESKAGAQPKEYIIEPNLEQFTNWQELSGQQIKTITIAPEHDATGEFMLHLNRTGVNVSAGHTGTDYTGMKTAVTQGVRQVTHLCNAMSGIHHRDIGVVGAAFKFNELRSELIADGIHVAPEMLQLIYDNIGSDRIILITDAMRAKSLEPGNYELGGQPVIVTEDRAELKNGSLAGSILKMDDGARNMLSLEGVTLSNIIEMASVNPAKQIGVFERKGSIAEHKDADLLLVDDELNIKYTICRGVIAKIIK